MDMGEGNAPLDRVDSHHRTNSSLAKRPHGDDGESQRLPEPSEMAASELSWAFASYGRVRRGDAASFRRSRLSRSA